MDTTPSNPLIAPILTLLKEHPEGLSEYEMMGALKAQNNLFGGQNQLELFHQHFYIMNALYQLQNKLVEERMYLAISPLCIKFENLPINPSSQAMTAPQNEKLKDYYLDWSNYETTTAEEVETMLQGFWQKYYAQDKRLTALTVFGLEVDTDWNTIHNSYRKLVAKYHPDKGGDQYSFIAVMEAYEVLRHFYSPSSSL